MAYTLHKKMTHQLRAQGITAGENDKLLKEDLMHAAINLLGNVSRNTHLFPAYRQLSHV
jgi:hypothetical protein